jgi:hypothetical protein
MLLATPATNASAKLENPDVPAGIAARKASCRFRQGVAL